jgi:hypothetical protein
MASPTRKTQTRNARCHTGLFARGLPVAVARDARTRRRLSTLRGCSHVSHHAPPPDELRAPRRGGTRT